MFGELRPIDGGSPILLEKPSVTVGQDRTCDVVIEHPSVSANHCHMEFRDGHWFIEDLGSRSGIGVNGEKVESAWVPALSVINIGTLEFDLRYSSVAATTQDHGSFSAESLSKLDRVLKSIMPQRGHRIQVRADQPTPSEAPMTSLGVLKTSVGGAQIPLLYEELYVGRDAEADIVLPYLAVAKTHCVLRFRDGNWLVRDLNNNGITIDGQAVTEGRLPPGAVLGVATHHFEIAYLAAADPLSPQTILPTHDSELLNSDAVPQVLNDNEFDIDNPEIIDSDDELEVADKFTVDVNAQPVSNNAACPIEGMRLAMEEMFPQVEPSFVPRNVESQSVPVQTGQSLTTVNPTSPPARTQTEGRSVMLSPVTVAASRPKAGAIKRMAVDGPTVSNEQWRQLVRHKHERVQQFLNDREFGGLLLTRPASMAWATCGADVPCGLDGQPAAAVLMTPDSRILLARKADGDLFLHRAIPEIGLNFCDCDWPCGVSELSQSLGVKKSLACDQPFDSCADASADVAAMRLPLSPQEVISLRKLGIRVSRAVEKAAREFQRGDTEAQIAGDVASRMIRHEVVPERIQVWGDGRTQNWQNWDYGRDPVERDCTICVVARRRGLHVAVSRTVSFGIPSKELRWTFADMSLAHATAMFCSRGQAKLSTVWSQVEQACGNLGNIADWRATDPGCVTGYELCEAPISATSRFRLRAGMPVIWRSAIGSARAVDTILIRESDCKVVTQTGEWPQSRIDLDTSRFYVPAVLQRNS